MGGVALGSVAAGGLALGWVGADGAVAIARESAQGQTAAARHANDALAQRFFAGYPWMSFDSASGRLLANLAYLPLLLLIPQWLRTRRKHRRA
jgi:hypothetical protein